MMKNIKIILTVLALLLGTVTFAAFSEPACDPTGPGGPGACNTAEPVNISSTAQAKTGLLGLGGLLLNLVGNLSFGTPAPAGQFLTTDTTGRAIWSVPAGGTGGPGDTLWGGSLTDAIYSRNSGLVGIGTQTPNSKLTVTGGDINITSANRGLISTVTGDANWASIIPRNLTTGNMILTPAIAGGQQRDVVIGAGKLCLGGVCLGAWPAGGTGGSIPDDMPRNCRRLQGRTVGDSGSKACGRVGKSCLMARKDGFFQQSWDAEVSCGEPLGNGCSRTGAGDYCQICCDTFESYPLL